MPIADRSQPFGHCFTASLAALCLCACAANSGSEAEQASDLDAAGGGGTAGAGGGLGGEPTADAAPLLDASDAAGSRDAAPDAAADTAPPDLALPMDAQTAEPDAAAPPLCPDRPVIPADAARVVLVGHPFTDVPGVDGTMIHGLTLQPNGRLDDDGIRLDVEVKAARIAFAPHGLLAFVLGEDGTLVSVFVAAAEGMAVVDRVSLPGADYGDLHVSADGETVWVTGSNVNETSGISTIHVDCEGLLTVDDAAYFPLRLAESTAFLPGDTRALVLGGQTVFEPVDPNDVRLLERQGAGFREVGGFDLFHDFVGAGRIAVSPDGRLGALPNNSAFSEEGGQMMLVEIDGDAVREAERVLEVPDPSEALFSLDGQTLVLTQVEPGRLNAYRIENGAITETTVLTGIGLADQIARVERGPLADTLLIPSIDPNGGPNITQVRITGPGQLQDLGETQLGEGLDNIVTPIAVQP
jgi:hypothetical protein